MRLLDSAIRGLHATVQGGYGSRYGSVFGRGFGTGREGIDVRAEAGARIDNSIVYTIISKTTNELIQAPIVVKRANARGKMVIVEDHPIAGLLKNPVPWYSGATLRSCWYMAKILHGAAYVLKHRSPDGKLIGLEYLPLSSVKPISNPGSGNFIDAYQVTLSTGVHLLDPIHVMQLGWHTTNPWQPALPVGPLESVLPEIAADNRAARFEANVLRNGGKAHILTPRGTDQQGRPIIWGKEQRDQLSQLMREEAAGDSAGSMLASALPMDVIEIGWKPTDLQLGPMRDLSEERIAAAVGAPLSWLGLGSGLATENNRATRQAVNEQAVEYIENLIGFEEMQLTYLLVPELGEEGDEVCYDRRRIPSLRKVKRNLLELGVKATGKAVMTVDEYREEYLDMDPNPALNDVATAKPSQNVPDAPEDEEDEGNG